MVRNQHEEAILRLLVPVLNRPEARADLPLLGRALITAAYSAPLIDVATADDLAARAIQLARQLDDTRLIIESLTIRVHLDAYYGDGASPGRGLALGREALERSRGLGDDVLLAAGVLEYLFFSEQAEWNAVLAEAIASTKRSGDLFIRSLLLQSGSFRAAQIGDLQVSRMQLEEAMRILQAFGQELASVADSFGFLAYAEGKLDDARRYFERALLLYRRDGDHVSMAYELRALACVASDIADWERAAQLHGAAQALLDRKRAAWTEFGTRVGRESLARIRAGLGDELADLAYAQGAALGLNEAVALALERGPDMASRPAMP
jgi:hypothetical protein